MAGYRTLESDFVYHFCLVHTSLEVAERNSRKLFRLEATEVFSPTRRAETFINK